MRPSPISRSPPIAVRSRAARSRAPTAPRSTTSFCASRRNSARKRALAGVPRSKCWLKARSRTLVRRRQSALYRSRTRQRSRRSARGLSMDQTLGLQAGNRKFAIERLRNHVVGAVDAAAPSDTPFTHLVLDRVFPDDVYAAMLANMPEARDYRPMHGRAKGHDLADGTHTRVKIDLYPEYIRHLPPQKRAVWDVVGRALCSSQVRDAFIRRLAPPLMR